LGTAPRLVDVGAFKGSFTDAALAYWRPAQVWLVEAHPEYAAALRLKYAQRPTCRVVHCAVASADGIADLRENQHGGSSSTLRLNPEYRTRYGPTLREDRAIPVPARTLDALFAAENIGQVDLMKVDIQGAERQLIEGGRQALQRVANLYIEVLFGEQYVGAALFDELHGMLRGCGFRLRGLSEGRLGADGALAYADALFIRPTLQTANANSPALSAHGTASG